MLSEDEIAQFISGGKPPEMLAELFSERSAAVFFDAEERVLEALEPCRANVLRVTEYLAYMDSIRGWECLVCDMWGHLTDEEKTHWRKRASDTLEKGLIRLWTEGDDEWRMT